MSHVTTSGFPGRRILIWEHEFDNHVPQYLDIQFVSLAGPPVLNLFGQVRPTVVFMGKLSRLFDL
jgi:hypothetical protein